MGGCDNHPVWGSLFCHILCSEIHFCRSGVLFLRRLTIDRKASKVRLSGAEKREIDELFAHFKGRGQGLKRIEEDEDGLREVGRGKGWWLVMASWIAFLGFAWSGIALLFFCLFAGRGGGGGEGGLLKVEYAFGHVVLFGKGCGCGRTAVG